jgi:hypothetical protein
MDPITTAIIGGLTAGATKVATNALGDAYAGLKSLLERKFGADSEVARKVADLEARPDSQGRQASLQEEVAIAKADQDQELVQAANALLEQVKAVPQGAQYIQNVSGSGAAAMHGGVAAGQGGIAVGGNMQAPPQPSQT